MPPPASHADWEMILVMPLGVIANQLVKIEGDLRFLSMKVTESMSEEGGHPVKAVDTRLNLILEALESIDRLLVRLRADLHPKNSAVQSAVLQSNDFPRHKLLPEQDD